ncbi:hypothetical protein V6243_18250, partial [Cobetia marina]
QVRQGVTDVAKANQDTQVAILRALQDEFSDDLSCWEAEIDPETLAFTFQSPVVLFATGSASLRPRFEQIL